MTIKELDQVAKRVRRRREREGRREKREWRRKERRERRGPLMERLAKLAGIMVGQAFGISWIGWLIGAVIAAIGIAIISGM